MLAFIRSKKIAFICVGILFIILLWSVVFGYQRRSAAELQKKIDATSQEISSKLKEAEDEAYLDPDRAISLIEESKSLYKDLTEELKGDKKEDLSKILTQISESEARIVKREEKPYKEFYDLGLENKDAKGSKLYREKNLLAILDADDKKVYLLDLDKKSLEQYTAAEVADATDIAVYNKEVFIASKAKGIHKFTAENKARLMIKPDSRWEAVDDIEIFNGNIYVLDSGTGDLYKYFVTESGYSDKSSYFISASPSDLSKGADMAIDGAVYITSGDIILKYLRGAADPFETKFPQKAPQFSGLYTGEDLTQLLAWDTKGGAIYILGKEGEYIRQITSSIVKKAQDVFAYDDTIYIFDGKKLYSIPID